MTSDSKELKNTQLSKQSSEHLSRITTTVRDVCVTPEKAAIGVSRVHWCPVNLYSPEIFIALIAQLKLGAGSNHLVALATMGHG